LHQVSVLTPKKTLRFDNKFVQTRQTNDKSRPTVQISKYTQAQLTSMTSVLPQLYLPAVM